MPKVIKSNCVHQITKPRCVFFVGILHNRHDAKSMPTNDNISSSILLLPIPTTQFGRPLRINHPYHFDMQCDQFDFRNKKNTKNNENIYIYIPTTIIHKTSLARYRNSTPPSGRISLEDILIGWHSTTTTAFYIKSDFYPRDICIQFPFAIRVVWYEWVFVCVCMCVCVCYCRGYGSWAAFVVFIWWHRFDPDSFRFMTINMSGRRSQCLDGRNTHERVPESAHICFTPKSATPHKTKCIIYFMVLSLCTSLPAYLSAFIYISLVGVLKWVSMCVCSFARGLRCT